MPFDLFIEVVREVVDLAGMTDFPMDHQRRLRSDNMLTAMSSR
jgi:hypothetical protein